MRVQVKLFAVLKEGLGKEVVEFEMPEGATCAHVISLLGTQFTKFKPLFERSLVAINGEYAERATLLSPGDELAVLTPVSGG
jgi:MoaD family protein